jgi:hypothetical protein
MWLIKLQMLLMLIFTFELFIEISSLITSLLQTFINYGRKKVI